MAILIIVALLSVVPVQMLLACWTIKADRGAWLGVSYLFWSLFSLINPMFLYGVFVPYLFPFMWSVYRPYWSFLLPILLLTLPLAMLLSWYCLRNSQIAQERLQQIVFKVDCYATHENYPIYPETSNAAKAFIFNLIFLLTFNVIIELALGWEKHQALKQYPVTCFENRLFLSSLAEVGQSFRLPHAHFVAEGKAYSWSYVKWQFVERDEAISRNWPRCK